MNTKSFESVLFDDNNRDKINTHFLDMVICAYSVLMHRLGEINIGDKNKVFKWACCEQHLNVIKFMVETVGFTYRECDRYSEILDIVFRKGNLEIIKYLKENFRLTIDDLIYHIIIS